MKKYALVGLVALAQAMFARVCAKDIALESGGDIAQAITETGGSGTITLAAGMYTNKTEITVPSGVTIKGAGSGDDGSIITSSVANQRYMTISGGIVEDVKIQGQKITCKSITGLGVYLTAGTLRNSRVTGFSSGAYYEYGAVCLNGENAVVEYCEIDSNLNVWNNDVDHKGAGVYLIKGEVKGCRIHGNASNSGAGVWMKGGTLCECVIYENTLRYEGKGNQTMGTGGGVYAEGGVIASCTIAGNSATIYNGVGGLYLKGKSVTVNACTICGNTAYNSTSIGFPDFEYDDARVEANVSLCRLPVAFGTDPYTTPAFFTEDWTLCRFTADKTEAFVGDTITFTGDDNSTWTVSEAAGTYDVTRTIGGETYTAKNAVRFAPASITVSSAEDLIAAVNGAVSNEKILIEAGEYEIPSALVINRAIALDGAGMDKTTIKLKSGVADRVLLIGNANATVANLTTEGGKVGFYAQYNEGNVNDIYGISVWINKRGGTLEACRVTKGKTGNHYQKGVLAVTGEKGRVTRCLIDGNDNCHQSSSGNGWGVLYMNAGVVESCIVSNNYAYTAGGAYVRGGTLRNCTFYKNKTWRNSAINAVGGQVLDCVSMDSTSIDTTVTSTGLPEWAGTAACFDTCAFVDFATLPNDTCMTVADPFVDAAKGDLHLKTGSAGLQDKGKNYDGIEYLGDYDGNPRLSGEAVDIGAYELDASQFTCSFTCDKAEGFKGDTFTFTPELGNPPTGVTFTYAWTFNNGQGSVIESSSEIAAAELGIGTWNVTLTVTASSGKTATNTRTAFVTVAVRDLYAAPSGEGTFPYDDATKGTSDLAALMALAIDGSTIHFGAGEFPTTSEIVLKRGITFSGEGMFKTTLRQTTKGLRVMTINHANAVCEKMTITGGTLNVDERQGDSKGISVKIDTNGGTLRECRVTGGNPKTTDGAHFQYGNIAVLGEAGHVDRCLVDGNRNMFQASSGDGYGGGIYLKAGLVENCMVTNNYAWTGGGAYVVGGVLRNCTFYKNDSLRSGGVYVTGGSIVNCVFANDTSVSTKDSYVGRPEWGNEDGTGTYFVNCAFTGIEAAQLPGDSSFIVGNPFADVDNGDFTPAAGEGGLRDAGETHEGADESVDYLGNPRLSGSAIDIGCIEADATAFACSADATPQACFAGTAVQFIATIVNAPEGVTFGYDWKLTDRFGNVTESHEANPVLELPAGLYSIALTVYNVDKPSSQTSITPLVDYVHVAVHDSYATAGNTNPVYPYDTAEKGSTNILELIAEAIAGTTIHVGPGVFTNSGEMVVERGITITGAGMDKTLIRQGKQGKRVMTLNHPDAVCEKVALTGGSLSAIWQQEDHFGVGVWIADKGGTLRDCRVSGNVADGHYQHGGGVYVSEGLVDRCVIEENTNTWHEVDGYGAGVAAERGIVQNCLIRNNTATQGGGAWISKTAVMRNCTLVGNHAVHSPVTYTSKYVGGFGGGLVFSKEGGTIENCILWANTSDYTDPAGGGSELTFNTGAYDAGYNYTFRSTAVPKTVTSEIDGLVKINDPVFRNATTGDYTLRVTSPCRNAGTNGDWAGAAKDLDGNPRVYGKAIDLGCYELQYGYGLMLIVR